MLGEDYSLIEIANMITKKFQAKLKYKQWPEKDEKIESGHTVFDSSKIKDTFNFTLKHHFEIWLKDLK
jgi:hypothetical protein